MEMFTPANLIALIAFGLIGWYAFRYGRKQEQWKTMVLGMGLMVYPYFISGTVWLYTVGALLTGALFVFRD